MHRAQPFLLSLPTGAGKPPKYLQGSICFLSPTPTLSDGLAGTRAVVYVWCAPQGVTCWKEGPQCGVGGLGPLRGQAYREVIGSLAVLGNWPCLVLRKGLLGKSRSFPFPGLWLLIPPCDRFPLFTMLLSSMRRCSQDPRQRPCHAVWAFCLADVKLHGLFCQGLWRQGRKASHPGPVVGLQELSY